MWHRPPKKPGENRARGPGRSGGRSGGRRSGGAAERLDLISPLLLLLIYRKLYGGRLTLRLLGIFWLVMSVTGLLTELIFRAAGRYSAPAPSATRRTRHVPDRDLHAAGTLRDRDPGGGTAQFPPAVTTAC